jgi:hypothetical protein
VHPEHQTFKAGEDEVKDYLISLKKGNLPKIQQLARE